MSALLEVETCSCDHCTYWRDRAVTAEAKVINLAEKLNEYQAWEERRLKYDRKPNQELSAKAARFACYFDRKAQVWAREGKIGPQQINVKETSLELGFGEAAGRAALDELKTAGHLRLERGKKFQVTVENGKKITIEPILVEVLGRDPDEINARRNHGGDRCPSCGRSVDEVIERRYTEIRRIKRTTERIERRCKCGQHLGTVTGTVHEVDLAPPVFRDQTPDSSDLQFEGPVAPTPAPATLSDPQVGDLHVNHHRIVGDRSESTVLADGLPEELKVFQRVNGARDRLGAAIAYARAGFKVFPCHAPTIDGCTCGKAGCTDVGKHPRTPCGVHDATTNEETIKRRWRQWPNANIGISTDGLVVIDPDAPEPGKPDGLAAWDELAERLSIPPTLTARTGSGGKHLVYRAPDGVKIGNSCKGLPAGVHIRGAGGYIIVAPSVHESGERYTWTEIRPIAPLPDAVLEVLVPPEPSQLPQPPRPIAPDGHRPPVYTNGYSIPKGNRNEGLKSVAGGMIARGYSGQELEDLIAESNWNRCRPPLPDDEARGIARSVEKTARERGGV